MPESFIPKVPRVSGLQDSFIPEFGDAPEVKMPEVYHSPFANIGAASKPFEAKKYSEWATENAVDEDTVDDYKRYSGYLRVEALRQGAYSPAVESDLMGSLAGHLASKGLIKAGENGDLGAAAEELGLFNPTEASDDQRISIALTGLNNLAGDPKAEEAKKALVEYVSLRDQVASLGPDVAPESAERLSQLEELTKGIIDPANPLYSAAKKTLVNSAGENNEAPMAEFVSVDDKGVKSVSFSMNPEAIDKLGFNEALARSIEKGLVSPENALAALNQNERVAGSDVPFYKFLEIEKASDTLDALSQMEDSVESSKTTWALDKIVKYSPIYNSFTAGKGWAGAQKDAAEIALDLAGKKTLENEGPVSTNPYQGTWFWKTLASDREKPLVKLVNQYAEHLADIDAGGAGNQDLFSPEREGEVLEAIRSTMAMNDVVGEGEAPPSPETLKAVLRKTATKRAYDLGLFKLHTDPAEAHKNIRTSGGPLPEAHPSLFLNKDLFDAAIAGSPSLNAGQKKYLEDSRKIRLTETFDYWNNELNESLDYAGKWNELVFKRTAEGVPKGDILEEFFKTEDNFDQLKDSAMGVFDSVKTSVTDMLAFVPAWAGNKAASDVLVSNAESKIRRREIARAFGVEYGFWQDAMETVAPILADVAATVVLAGPSSGASVLGFAGKYGSKLTAQGLMKGIVGGAFRASAGEAAETVAQKAMLKGLVRNTVGEADTLKLINGYNQTLKSSMSILPAQFIPAANRAGAMTYGSTYAGLADTNMTHEEKHQAAKGAALLAGATTGIITAAFGAIGRGGLEDVVLSGATRGQMKAVLARISNVSDISDATFNAIVKKQLKESLKKHALGAGGVVKTLGVSAAEEGVEEGLDELVNGIVQDTYNRKSTNFGDALQQSLHAALLGGVFGSAIPGAKMAGQAVKAKVAQNSNSILPENLTAQARTSLQALEEEFVTGVTSQLEKSGSPVTAKIAGDLLRARARQKTAGGLTRSQVVGALNAPEAPAAVETQAPAAVETQAPAAVETQAPAAVETQAPAAVETQAPAAVETQAPAAVETQAPAAEAAQETLPTPTPEISQSREHYAKNPDRLIGYEISVPAALVPTAPVDEGETTVRVQVVKSSRKRMKDKPDRPVFDVQFIQEGVTFGDKKPHKVTIDEIPSAVLDELYQANETEEGQVNIVEAAFSNTSPEKVTAVAAEAGVSKKTRAAKALPTKATTKKGAKQTLPPEVVEEVVALPVAAKRSRKAKATQAQASLGITDADVAAAEDAATPLESDDDQGGVDQEAIDAIFADLGAGLAAFQGGVELPAAQKLARKSKVKDETAKAAPKSKGKKTARVKLATATPEELASNPLSDILDAIAEDTGEALNPFSNLVATEGPANPFDSLVVDEEAEKKRELEKVAAGVAGRRRRAKLKKVKPFEIEDLDVTAIRERAEAYAKRENPENDPEGVTADGFMESLFSAIDAIVTSGYAVRLSSKTGRYGLPSGIRYPKGSLEVISDYIQNQIDYKYPPLVIEGTSWAQRPVGQGKEKRPGRGSAYGLLPWKPLNKADQVKNKSAIEVSLDKATAATTLEDYVAFYREQFPKAVATDEEIFANRERAISRLQATLAAAEQILNKGEFDTPEANHFDKIGVFDNDPVNVAALLREGYAIPVNFPPEKVNPAIVLQESGGQWRAVDVLKLTDSASGKESSTGKSSKSLFNPLAINAMTAISDFLNLFSKNFGDKEIPVRGETFRSGDVVAVERSSKGIISAEVVVEEAPEDFRESKSRIDKTSRANRTTVSEETNKLVRFLYKGGSASNDSLYAKFVELVGSATRLVPRNSPSRTDILEAAATHCVTLYNEALHIVALRESLRYHINLHREQELGGDKPKMGDFSEPQKKNIRNKMLAELAPTLLVKTGVRADEAQAFSRGDLKLIALTIAKRFGSAPYLDKGEKTIKSSKITNDNLEEVIDSFLDAVVFAHPDTPFSYSYYAKKAADTAHKRAVRSDRLFTQGLESSMTAEDMDVVFGHAVDLYAADNEVSTEEAEQDLRDALMAGESGTLSQAFEQLFGVDLEAADLLAGNIDIDIEIDSPLIKNLVGSLSQAMALRMDANNGNNDVRRAIEGYAKEFMYGGDKTRYEEIEAMTSEDLLGQLDMWIGNASLSDNQIHIIQAKNKLGTTSNTRVTTTVSGNKKVQIVERVVADDAARRFLSLLHDSCTPEDMKDFIDTVIKQDPIVEKAIQAQSEERQETIRKMLFGAIRAEARKVLRRNNNGAEAAEQARVDERAKELNRQNVIEAASVAVNVAVPAGPGILLREVAELEARKEAFAETAEIVRASAALTPEQLQLNRDIIKAQKAVEAAKTVWSAAPKGKKEEPRKAYNGAVRRLRQLESLRDGGVLAARALFSGSKTKARNEKSAEFLGLKDDDPQSVLNALQVIVSSPKVYPPQYRVLAAMLLKNPSVVLNTKFFLRTFTANSFAGTYSTQRDGTPVVQLNLNGSNGTGLAGVLLHEYAHAVTASALSADVNSLNPAQRSAITRLKGILKLARREAGRQGIESPIIEDGLSSLDEFVTHLFTSTSFQEYMRQLQPQSGRSIFRRAWDAIMSMFGVSPSDTPYYQAMDALYDLSKSSLRSYPPSVNALVSEIAEATATRLGHIKQTFERENPALAAALRGGEETTEDLVAVTGTLLRDIRSVLPDEAILLPSEDFAGTMWESNGIIYFNPAGLWSAIGRLSEAERRDFLARSLASEEMIHRAAEVIPQKDFDAYVASLSAENYLEEAALYAIGKEDTFAAYKEALESADPAVALSMRKMLAEEKIRRHVQQVMQGETSEETYAFYRANAQAKKGYVKGLKKKAFELSKARRLAALDPKTRALIGRVILEVQAANLNYRQPANGNGLFETGQAFRAGDIIASQLGAANYEPTPEDFEEFKELMGDDPSNIPAQFRSMMKDFQPIFNLMDMPMMEVGTYKEPSNRFLKMLQGSFDPKVTKVVAQHEAFVRMISTMLKNYHSDITRLSDEAIKDGVTKEDLAELVAEASGSTDTLLPESRILKIEAKLDSTLARIENGDFLDEAAIELEVETIIDNDEFYSALPEDSTRRKNKEALIRVEAAKREKAYQRAEAYKAKQRLVERMESRMQEQALARRNDAMKRLAAYPTLLEKVIQLRQLLDGFSKKGTQVFGLKPELKAHFDSQMGLYLTRSYKMFYEPDYLAALTDPKHKDYVDYETVRENAANFFEQQWRSARLENLLSENPELSLVNAKNQVDAEYTKFSADGGMPMGQRFLLEYLEKFDHKVNDPLTLATSDAMRLITNNIKRRKEVPQPLQELLGVYNKKEGAGLVIRSISTVASMVSNQQMLNNVNTMGTKGGWLLTTEQYNELRARDLPAAQKFAPIKITGARGSTLNPMNEKYGPVEFATIVTQLGAQAKLAMSEDVSEHFIRQSIAAAANMTGKVMAIKTMGSVGHFFRNALSMPFFAIAQGEFGLLKQLPSSLVTELGQTTSTRSFAVRKGWTDEEIDIERTELIGLSILGDSVNANTLKDLLRGQTDPKELENEYANAIKQAAAATGEKAKALGRFLIRLEETMDTFYKVPYFYATLDLLEQAKEEGSGQINGVPIADMDMNTLRRIAADKVLRTAPAYSQTLPVVSEIVKSPIGIMTATFLRWKSEMFRTTANTFLLAKEEMESGNPVLVKKGRQRAAAMTTMLGGVSAGLPVLLSYVFGGIGDDEDWFLRRTQPEYMRNNSFIYYERGGRLRSIDLTFVNPFSFGGDAFARAGRELYQGNVVGAITKLVTVGFLEPALDQQILAGAVMNMANNTDPSTGRAIYYENGVDNWKEAAWKLTKFAGREAFVPRIAQDAYKAYNAAKSPDTLFDYSATGVLIQGILPFREHTIDLNNQYRRFVYESQASLSDINSEKNKLLGRKPIDDEEVAAVYEREVARVVRLNQELLKASQSAESLGATPKEIYSMMTDSGVGKRRAQLLPHRVMERRVPSAEFLQDFDKETWGPHRRELYLQAVAKYDRMFYFE